MDTTSAVLKLLVNLQLFRSKVDEFLIFLFCEHCTIASLIPRTSNSQWYSYHLNKAKWSLLFLNLYYLLLDPNGPSQPIQTWLQLLIIHTVNFGLFHKHQCLITPQFLTKYLLVLTFFIQGHNLGKKPQISICWRKTNTQVWFPYRPFGYAAKSWCVFLFGRIPSNNAWKPALIYKTLNYVPLPFSFESLSVNTLTVRFFPLLQTFDQQSLQ